MRARLGCFLRLILFAALPLLAAPSTPTPYRYFRVGAPRDRPATTRGGFVLMGGGRDLDEAFQWMCRRSGGGDFLVLRASGTDAYNPYIQKLCPAENSVATLILPSRAAALDPFVARAIRAAAAIFVSGGDQSNYINFWRGTPVQRELDRAIARGVPLGGTSAGLAVLGEYAYSAQHDRPDGPDLTSAAALANPFDPQVVVVRGFLNIPALRGLIADTHFHARNRLGRLLVFMARANVRHGIGVDQHTALLVDPGGRAVAAGTGAVYMFNAAAAARTCVAGHPLTFGPLAVRRLPAGEHFDLAHWTGEGVAYTLRAEVGKLSSSQPAGAIY